MTLEEFKTRQKFLAQLKALAERYGWTGDFVEIQMFYDFCCTELKFPKEDLTAP
jgi:hypothetical protein